MLSVDYTQKEGLFGIRLNSSYETRGVAIATYLWKRDRDGSTTSPFGSKLWLKWVRVIRKGREYVKISGVPVNCKEQAMDRGTSPRPQFQRGGKFFTARLSTLNTILNR